MENTTILNHLLFQFLASEIEVLVLLAPSTHAEDKMKIVIHQEW